MSIYLVANAKSWQTKVLKGNFTLFLFEDTFEVIARWCHSDWGHIVLQDKTNTGWSLGVRSWNAVMCPLLAQTRRAVYDRCPCFLMESSADRWLVSLVPDSCTIQLAFSLHNNTFQTLFNKLGPRAEEALRLCQSRLLGRVLTWRISDLTLTWTLLGSASMGLLTLSFLPSDAMSVNLASCLLNCANQKA